MMKCRYKIVLPGAPGTVQCGQLSVGVYAVPEHYDQHYSRLEPDECYPVALCQFHFDLVKRDGRNELVGWESYQIYQRKLWAEVDLAEKKHNRDRWIITQKLKKAR